MNSPSDPAHDARVVDFARSEVFERTYREGMALVEETAAYLDGQGRAEARALPRLSALAYAGETMRVSTRLMQVASWLMVQRAVRDGELTPLEARKEKYRLSDRPQPTPETFVKSIELPEPLRALAARADALFARVQRIDASINGEPSIEPAVAEQLARLRAAFGQG